LEVVVQIDVQISLRIQLGVVDVGHFVSPPAYLFDQPRLGQAELLEVGMDDMAVHDELRGGPFVRRRYVEIGRRGRQQLRLLQHRQLPARFDDGELHLSHGENALAAQLHAQVVEIVVEPLQRAFQNLSVLDDDGGLAVQQLAQAAAVQTETGSDQAPKRPQQQRQPRRDELEVRLDGQAGGDAADGDAEDVVEEVELSQLTLAEH